MIEVALLLSALSILKGINHFLLTSCSIFRRIVLESPHDSGYVVKWFKLPFLGVQHVFTGVYLIIHSSILLFICDAIGVENTKKTSEISTAWINLCRPDVRVRQSHAKGRIDKRSECKNLMFIFYINLCFSRSVSTVISQICQDSSRIAFWIDAILVEDRTKVF